MMAILSSHVAAGEYIVTAVKPGFETLEFGQRRAFEPGEVIALKAGERRERVDIALPRRSAITGRIVDEYGEGVEGAVVHAMQVRFVQGRRRLVDVRDVPARSTDDRGRYRLSNLSPGQYIVSATIGQVGMSQPMSDVGGYAPSYAPGTWNPAEAQRIAVGLSEDVADVDFPLVPAPTASIRGTAHWSKGDPVLGAVRLHVSRRSGVVAADVGARIEGDGSFEFANIAPGEYVVQVYHGQADRSTEGEFAAQRVVINGADIADVHLRASRGSTIAGRVTLEGGGKVSAGDIELMPVPADPDLSPLSGPVSANIHDDLTFDVAGTQWATPHKPVARAGGVDLESCLCERRRRH